MNDSDFKFPMTFWRWLCQPARSNLEVRNDHVQKIYENRKEKYNRRISNKMLETSGEEIIHGINLILGIITFELKSVVEIDVKLVKD